MDRCVKIKEGRDTRRVKNASGASVSLVADVAIVAANVVASECVLAVRLTKRLALIATIASLAQDIGARARRGFGQGSKQ